MKAESFNGNILDIDESNKKASIPFFISRDMSQQLADLGYSKEFQNSLTPEKALDIIKESRTYKKESDNSIKQDLDVKENNKKYIEKQIEIKKESIKETQEEINAIEAELGISSSNEVPPSIKSLEDELKKLNTELGSSEKKETSDQKSEYKEQDNFQENNNGNVEENKSEKKDEDIEKKLEIIKNIKNTILENFNVSIKNLVDLKKTFDSKISSLGLNGREAIKKLDTSFSDVVKISNETRMFLFFNINSLESLLYLNQESTSPEKLKEIKEMTKIEKLEEINSSVEKYFKNTDKKNVPLKDFFADEDRNIGSEENLLDLDKILLEYGNTVSEIPDMRENDSKNLLPKLEKGEMSDFVLDENGVIRKKTLEDRNMFTTITNKNI